MANLVITAPDALGRASPGRYSHTGGSVFASLQRRFTRSRRRIAHCGIALLAGAGLIAVLAPTGAAANTRPAAQL
jgi:hypothetical protein